MPAMLRDRQGKLRMSRPTRFSLARGRNSCCDQDNPYFLDSAGYYISHLGRSKDN